MSYGDHYGKKNYMTHTKRELGGWTNRSLGPMVSYMPSLSQTVTL